MTINTENTQITKHQRYYRKNRERRKQENAKWKKENPVRTYVINRKSELRSRRSKIINKLKELNDA